jgi:S-adenosylmethionine uptake transporter
MLAACLAFALMGACVKFASQFFNSAELVAWRGVVSMALIYAFARSRGIGMATTVPGMHLWRSLIGVASLGTWFYAIAHLPLATAMTLNYMSSLWMASFVVGGSLLLALRPRGDAASAVPAEQVGAEAIGPRLAADAQSGQEIARVFRQQGPLLATLLAGFAGVLLVLRPDVRQGDMLAGVMGLLSGLGSAFAYLQVIALGRIGEPEERTVFYFATGCAVVGVLCLPFAGVSPWPGWQAALWLLPMGALASMGQWAMTRAYAAGSTLLVANLQYAGVVFASLLGIVLFNEVLPWQAWTGIALVIGSAVVATYLRAKK